MAKQYQDNCVDCTSLGVPCRGRACHNKRVPYYTCDDCGEEYAPEDLYDDYGEMLCEKCLLNQYKTVAQIEEEYGENYYEEGD